MRKRYNTPINMMLIKTRLSDEEYADFTKRLAPYGMSGLSFCGRQSGGQPYAPLSMCRRSMRNCFPLSGSWLRSTGKSAATCNSDCPLLK